MEIADEYALSQYQDLGLLENSKCFFLKRHKIRGYICVQKRVSAELEDIYRFLQRTKCPNIPQIYECILDEKELIILEEYVPGRNLEELLQENKIFELEAVHIVFEICNALKVLHHASPPIVCRDLKAENVMLDEHGGVKLVDFNIARKVQEGKTRDTNLLGTAEYAAPEQYGYFQTDNRTDIYAIGVLINYMILGKFPVEQMVHGPAREVVTRCTYLEPGARYQTVEELEKHLRELYRSGTQLEATKQKSWLIPGFRTKKAWRAAIAILGYLCAASISFSIEPVYPEAKVTEGMIYAERLIVWAAHLLFIFLVFNYRGWREALPLIGHKNKAVRFLSYGLLYFLLLVMAVVFIIVIESLIF